jgi:hypothetical protein
MEATAPTAREQFVNDFTMVVDNNSEAYFETIDLVRSKKESVPAISEAMREVFEEQVSKALLVLRQSEEVEPITADIMHEMLLGWGSDVFDDIARHLRHEESHSQASNHDSHQNGDIETFFFYDSRSYTEHQRHQQHTKNRGLRHENYIRNLQQARKFLRLEHHQQHGKNGRD